MSKEEKSAVLDEARLTFDVADVQRATGLSKPAVLNAIKRGDLDHIATR